MHPFIARLDHDYDIQGDKTGFWFQPNSQNLKDPSLDTTFTVQTSKRTFSEVSLH